MIASAGTLLVLLLRAALAAVLIAAGAAKLADVPGFAATLVGLGLPARRQGLVAATAYAIPCVELGVGFLALSGAWPVATSLALLVVFGLFTVLTGWAARRRSGVACRCFGTLTDSQFGRRGLARNAALTTLAALVLWDQMVSAPRPGAPAWATALLLLGAALFGLAAAEAARTLARLGHPQEG